MTKRKNASAGELALDGSLRSIRGAIVMAKTTKRAGLTTLFVPQVNVNEAALVGDMTIIGVRSLREIFLHLKKEAVIAPSQPPVAPTSPQLAPATTLDDIYSQEHTKRAMIIAAAGRHNILLSGSPGAGKTMLARALPDLLPVLSNDERLAVTKLYSLAGELRDLSAERPFRNPRHTASRTALIGGGTHPRPGDISLAHLGVLFLDELPEYPRAFLESLRQPLEDKSITVSRVAGHSTYSSRFYASCHYEPVSMWFFGRRQS